MRAYICIIHMCMYFTCVPIGVHAHMYVHAHSTYVSTRAPGTRARPHTCPRTPPPAPPAPAPPRLSASAWRLPHAAGPPGSFAYCPRGSQWAARGGAALGGVRPRSAGFAARPCPAARRHVGVPAAPCPALRERESGGWESSAPRELCPN